MKTPKKLIKRLSAVLMAGIMFAGAAAVRAEGVPSVSASSALLLDAGSGRVIFEKDADTERPMARPKGRPAPNPRDTVPPVPPSGWRQAYRIPAYR